MKKILFFVVLGTIARVIFSVLVQPWHLFPDHQVWQLSIDYAVTFNDYSFEHFIYYPHQGYSILISAIAILLKNIGFTYSLVIVSFIFDILIRFFQLYIVKNLYGEKVLIYFGIFTVFALPIMIVWAPISYESHLASICPFIFVYLFKAKKQNNIHYCIIGLFLGLAIWFSYFNFVLALLLPIYLSYFKASYKSWLFVALGFLPPILAHIIIAKYCNPGFELTGFGDFSIRNLDFTSFELTEIKQLFLVWIKALGGSSLIIGPTEMTTTLLRLSWVGFIYYWIFSFIYKRIDRKLNSSKSLIFILIFLFLIIYALSPVYYDSLTNMNFNPYRHLAFIYPLMGLITIISILNSKNYRRYFLILMSFSLGSYLSYIVYNSYKSTPYSEQIGYISILKFGHKPDKVKKLKTLNTNNQEDFLIGAGGGYIAAIFGDFENSKEDQLESKVQLLAQILASYDTEELEFLKLGIRNAFKPGRTPIINKKVKESIIKGNLIE